MTFGVETIGNYNVKKLPNGKYSVAVNNGNLGACQVDAAAVEKLREKYQLGQDKVAFGAPKADNAKNADAKEKPSIGKKIAVGAASAFVPGLGQAINGDWGKALGIFAGNIGTAAAAFVFPPALLLNLGLNLYGIYDAYKNAK